MSRSLRNLELKAPLTSIKVAQNIARSIGAKDAGILRQLDTFYKVGAGRLKLREINSKKTELIRYHRPNRRGSRISSYSIKTIRDPTKAKRNLSHTYQKWIVVRKLRRLYLYKNARIHIDSVQGLGDFLEFEVLLKKGKQQARRLMSFLKDAFDVSNSRTFKGSYSDLLQRRRRFGSRRLS